MAVTLKEAPRIFAWVDVVDDLSGLEPTDEDWVSPGAIPETMRPLFAEVGRVYTPVMLANARALRSGAEKVETEVDGLPWVQQPFPYQGRCLAWVREEYARLDTSAKTSVDAALAGSGCEPLFTATP
jgi:hypothetical protein